MKGIDISYAQGTVNFDQLKTGVDFVIIRAGYTNAVDTQFKRNQSEARRVGIRRGYYWFTYPERIGDSQKEADEFVNTVGELQDGEFLVLDYEVNTGSPQYCRDFLDRVQARTGIKGFLYTNQNRTVAMDWTPVRSAGYPLWVAIYDNNPTAPVNTNGWPYVLKQYTADGRAPGIAGAVDLDYANDDPTKYGKSKMTIPDTDPWFARFDKIMLQIRGRTMGRDEFRKNFVGVEPFHMVEIVSDNPEADAATKAQSVGQQALKEDWQGQIAKLTADNETLKAEVGKQNNVDPNSIIVTQKGWAALFTAIKSFFNKNN